MSNQDFRILVVDDEKSLTTLLLRILKKEGFQVRSASNGKEALSVVEGFSPNLIITDLRMPEMGGLELLKAVKAKQPEIDIIILTAYATVENAVDAMKHGALDYLIKPLKDPDELRMAVAKVVERQSLVATNTLWNSQLAEGLPPVDIIFAGMEDVWNEIKQVAETDATVLLQGESGTGKSLVAKTLHHLSGKKGAFVEINCAAIPENLIESELFGHERGAFTGAVKAKRGKFELAQEGTIFLDEIGEMPLPAQAKLLRVLQERSFERVGGTVTLKTDARVIAATNQDLMERIKERGFREDLFYRLNVFPINLPPLRERKGALPRLAGYLVNHISAKVGRKMLEIPDDVLATLESYDWPGNVRELHNVLERAIILSKGPVVTIPPLVEERKKENNRNDGIRKERRLKRLADLEREAIEETLEQTKGHRRKAADILGISLRTLQYKLKNYGIKK